MAASRGRGAPPSLRQRLILTVVFCAILALVARSIIGDRGLFEVWRKQGAYEKLSEEVRILREESISLNEQIRSLKTDPLTIERIAREELGYSRPGEITFILREDDGSRPAVNP